MNPSNRFWLWCGKNSWRWFLAMLIAVIVFALVIASLIGLSRQPPGLHSIGRIALLTPIITSLAIITLADNSRVHPNTFYSQIDEGRTYKICYLKNTRLVMELEEKYPLT